MGTKVFSSQLVFPGLFNENSFLLMAVYKKKSVTNENLYNKIYGIANFF